MQLLVSGVLLGGMLAMLASGLALIFGVMRVINFAHGDFVVLGMYIAFFSYRAVSMHPLLLAVVAFVGVGLLGAVFQRILVSNVTGADEAKSHKGQIIMTLGVALIIQNGLLMFIGPNPRVLRLDITMTSFNLGGLFFNQARTLAFVAALFMTGALFLFLSKTRTGRSLRAAADDPEAATYVGADVPRAHMLAFGISTGMAGFGGALLATFYPMNPYVSWNFVVLLFIAVVLGGMGSIEGAFYGGMVIGVVQSLSLLFLPLQLQTVSVFVVFLLVLYLRPQGLFGKAVRA
jgi:branched-chain amino acid transport system permease protein